MTANILLQAQQGGAIPQLLFFAAIIAVFYFFMIRPQQKKQKEQAKFVNEVKKGDTVVTIGGIHGRIAEVEEDTFMLEIEKGARMRITKNSVSMESSKAANK
ncbi:MAG TPA: preprotein translocase subunit YajC [Cyclobacteriaceae bacterium]|nr:preprotein translocase subunit YajC [Cyclobacteriaceae bacterium]